MKQILFAIAAVISLFLPTSIVHAQIPGNPVCFYNAPAGQTPYVQYATRNISGAFVCPDPSLFTIMPPLASGQDIVGVCYRNIPPDYQPTYAELVGGAAGTIRCQDATDRIIPKTQFRLPGSTQPTPTPTSGSGTPTPTGTGGTPTPTGTGGGPAPTNPPTTQGDCEPKFHKEGPLCVPDNPFPDGIAGSGDVKVLAFNVIKYLLYFAGIIAVIMSIIGGYYIMTAAGDAAQAANGRKTLTNAIIGFIIVILSYAIIQTVFKFITT
jgi:hypothetical protein